MASMSGAEAERLGVTPALLRRALQREVVGLRATRLKGHGKTGALLLCVVPEYASMTSSGGAAASGTASGGAPPPPPSSVLLKLAVRPAGPSRAAWMARQDLREVGFYREHRHRLRAPTVHSAELLAGEDDAQPVTTCIVMEDLSGTHHSGELAVAPLYYGCGPAEAEVLAAVAVVELARLHASTWGCRRDAVGAETTAEFMLSTCFRYGAGHDAQKAELGLAEAAGGAAPFAEALLQRQEQTGCMLRVDWGQQHSAPDRAKFTLALAQAAPTLCLGSPEVNAMLRAVEQRRGESPAGSPAAVATWSRMTSQHCALCHGDFHPGNLMFPSGNAWADAQPGVDIADGLRVIDFQHWGWAPVSFELLYFIVHVLPMWALERERIPWLLQVYVDELLAAIPDGNRPQAAATVTVEALLEEMLAIIVEFYASFLVDDSYDCRQKGPCTPLQTLSVSAADPQATAGDAEEEATATAGMARVKWSFSSAAVAKSFSAVLTHASQLDGLLDLGAGLLFSQWGARQSDLGSWYRIPK